MPAAWGSAAEEAAGVGAAVVAAVEEEVWGVGAEAAEEAWVAGAKVAEEGPEVEAKAAEEA